MTAQIRAELFKIRTTRTTIALILGRRASVRLEPSSIMLRVRVRRLEWSEGDSNP